jgi:hypothetical protein
MKRSGKFAKRSNEKLWSSIKKKILRGSKGGPAGKWSARKAQLSVKEYKKRGGKYIGKKSPKNSLTKWSKEKWGYVGKNKKSRYLPEKVRKMLSPAEKKRENKLKGSKRGKWVSYSKSVKEKMKRAKIF